MPSKLGLLTLLLAAFVCCEPLVPRSGASTCVQNLQVYIYAGNNLKTGVVTLSSTQSGVVITITQQNGWQLTSADLYIGRNTSPCSLSSFPYRTGTLNRLTTYTWTIPFSAFGCNQIVNVAVHTVSVNPSLRNTGCGSQSTPSESCWAAGRSFASGYGYSFQWNICCVSPTTAVPTTKVATTQVPTTRVPTTRVPTTRVPTTAVPTTAVPTTKVPTTAVPTTRAATTRVATTRVATTRAATTRYVATTKHAATTAVPTTRNPTTRVPTTAVPTTRVPTTAVPTTAIPTTAIPTTAVPTTDVPTTDVPTTAVPTTGVATTGDVTPPPPPPYPYGTCDDKYHFFGYFPSFFNTYVYRNFTCYNSDTEGRIAAGGAIDLYNYGVACKLYTPAGVAQCSYNVTCDDIADDYGDIVDSVIAGGDVSIIQGSVYVGNIAIGGVFNNDITVVWGAGCTLFQGEVIDFDSTFDFLKNLAATVAQENSTGTIVNNWGSLTFQGTNNTDIEVFDIDASLLCSVYGITLDLTTVAPTASVFVNVAGDGFTCQNYQLNNFNASQTLWNFYEATTFSLQNIRWPGSILAPWAFVNGANSGVIDGQVFVDSWYSNTNCMQQNWTPFVGCLPSAGHIPSDDY